MGRRGLPEKGTFRLTLSRSSGTVGEVRLEEAQAQTSQGDRKPGLVEEPQEVKCWPSGSA
jgi:hypothetical protein